nr:Dna2/Cas4 domain-containing protein [Actinoplanes awajinensis]
MSAVPVRPAIEGLPETVPSRMVNEFVYCPRLFHLEWVQGRFATSDDVEEGRYVHRVVDEPGGDLPEPDDDIERFAGRTSRSFWLTSTDLGVSAKIDIVEITADGTVVPVDYKKGSPDKHGRPWPSDEIQSVLQALLLREAGYQVPHAEIWYAETRRRVSIPIDDQRLDDTRNLRTPTPTPSLQSHGILRRTPAILPVHLRPQPHRTDSRSRRGRGQDETLRRLSSHRRPRRRRHGTVHVYRPT